MAKFKPVGKAKESTVSRSAQTKGLIPCLLLVLGGIMLFSLFFYAALKSGAK